MKRYYFNPKLRVIDLSSEGMVTASGEGTTEEIPDADGHGSNMPWGSNERKSIWNRNSKIWK